MAEAIGRRHKYRTKKDRWYVVVKGVATSNQVDRVLVIKEKWAHSDEMEQASKEIDRLLKTIRIEFRKKPSDNNPRTDQSQDPSILEPKE